jgi:DNA helicase-2/ATP-dependent DNA helicase PcrA
MLGSKSGFDSVEECFDDLTPHIFALETGLSSDPPMNWRITNLDRYALTSSSDAHSPAKLAREATIFDIDLGYHALFDALRANDPAHYLGTLEFFPEEGKYHYDGHRKCGIVWDPKTTLAHGGICPVCGKPVTVGVMHRVESLADRPEGEPKPNAAPFHSLIPLPEIISEIQGVGPNSKRVQKESARILGQLGPELEILFDLPLEEIAAVGGSRLAEGIGRMRRGEVIAQPGYDGEFGVIRVFPVEEKSAGQTALFEPDPQPEPPAPTLFDALESEPVALRDAPISMNLDESPTSKGDDRQQTIDEMASEQPSSSVHRPSSGLPQSDLLSELNDAQREAVLTTDRPLIIVAGPGAGKTRTLTTRIAYLIREQGVDPASVLAITFTNKAAQEMRERLEALVGPEIAARITISTFHAFGAEILREKLGDEFSILDETQREKLVKGLFLGPNGKARRRFLKQLSTAKQHLLGPDDSGLAELCPDDPDFPIRYRAYQDALARDNALDFDDLIFRTVRLLAEDENALRALQARYRWISVDEYQDLNLGQYRLLRLLTAGGANLCVIGDPDQAIYGFRGADYRFFLRFQEDYPTARKIILQQNYRSAAAILDAAQQVIAKNPDREAIELIANFADDVKLTIYQAPTDKAEAEYVVHQIESTIGGTSLFSIDSGRVEDESRESGYSFGDFAVLYRLNALSGPLIEAFQRSGIPFQTVGQTPFSARPAVRLLLAGLNLLQNPARRVHRAALPDPLPEGWEDLAAWASAMSLPQLIERMAGLLPLPEESEEDVKKLADLAQPFGDDLPGFITHMALQTETDIYDPRADRVALMTLHAAKGLEFPVVFIIGCEESLLPYFRPGEEVDLEEERRLFYVGMTRAKHRLILTHARKRFLFGKEMHNSRSQFVDDIETALLEVKQMQARKKKKRKKDGPSQLSLF